MKVEIIFEDSVILVINKPPGIVCNRSETTKGIDTLQDWVERQDYWKKIIIDNKSGEAVEYFVKRSGLVHRLDKDTSGVMILAKSVEAYQSLVNQFAERKVKKEYLALVHGWLKPREGSIVLPLNRNIKNRKKFSVSSKGRKASTMWQIMSYYKNSEVNNSSKIDFSLVKIMPLTGRTHQIRVHLSHIKHPIVGDDKYLGKRRSKLDKNWCFRQFLHAFSIEFLHPKTALWVIYKAELALDLVKALNYLEEVII